MSAAASVPWYDSVEGFIWNAATGTLSPGQKTSLETAQATEVSNGSAGSVTYADALTQAQSDVSAILKINGADPSQASLFNNPGLDSLFQKAGWVVAIVAGAALIYFAIQAYRAFRA